MTQKLTKLFRILHPVDIEYPTEWSVDSFAQILSSIFNQILFHVGCVEQKNARETWGSVRTESRSMHELEQTGVHLDLIDKI